MTYNPDIHHRHSIRLKEYDYASIGAYFVTICALQRECLFGEISVPVGAGSKPALSNVAQEGEPASMELNEFGKLVDFTWNDLPNHNRNMCLDAFVVMPNHVHGIVMIENDRAGLEPAPTVSEIIRQLKTFSSKRINKSRDNPGCPVWQRNFYERVIRNEHELAKAREYIVNNPLKWALDKENPLNTI